METDQQTSYQHLLSFDFPHSNFLSSTSPLLTGCISTPKQEELTKSNDTNKNDQVHTIQRKPEAKGVGEGCSQSSQDDNDWSQWFDDEFASIYRQYQHQQQKEDQPEVKKKQQQKSTKKSVSTAQSSTKAPPPAKTHDPLSHRRQKRTIQNHPFSSISASTTTIYDIASLPDQDSMADLHVHHPSPKVQQELQPFPWPESVYQIYGWCRMAKRSQDVNSQVKLCRRLLATLASFNQEQTKSSHQCHAPIPPQSLQSSLLSLPSLSSASTSTSASICTSSSSSSSILVQAPPADHDHIRHVMMRECFRILKRQSNGQGVGKGGDSEAQYILANCYGMGLLGLTEDHTKAFKLYLQASKQAHPEAIYRTAVCYELGIGTRKDGQRAMIFYRKAARLSHAGGMYKLGMILLRGYYHTTPLPREAITWLQRAVSHVTTTNVTTTTTDVSPQYTSSSPPPSSLPSLYDTNQRHNRSTITRSSSQVHHHQAPHALHALAMLQMSKEVGNTTSLIADPVYAMELLHQAAKRDHVPSQLQLGHCFEHGQWVPVDEVLSIYWYTRAAQLDSPEACLAICGWYLTGTANKNILPPSDREAYLWARRAITLSAAAGAHSDHHHSTMAKAHFAVAVLLERGMNHDDKDRCVSGAESIKKVTSWMRKAAALGHQGASQWLQENMKVDRQQDGTAAEQRNSHHDVNDNVQIDKGEEKEGDCQV